MEKYLIEVPHGEDKNSCVQAIKIFNKTGSHFLTNAEWGCLDGEHKAWIIAEMESKEEARSILPPLFRKDAKIVKLTTFPSEQYQDPMKYHSA